MLIRLSLLLALATPVAAETCYFGANGTHATILPGAEAFAEIVVENRLAARSVRTCELTLYGVTFAVDYDAAPGELPDNVSVAVPPNFTADPPSAVIADNDQFTFLIHLGNAPGF